MTSITSHMEGHEGSSLGTTFAEHSIRRQRTPPTSTSISPSRKPSIRGLRTLQQLHSTEYPQDNVDNVITRPETDRTFLGDDENDGTRLRNAHSPNHKSTEGTPLFTITEQDSISTLKTMPSNQTFQRRVLTWQPPQTEKHDLRS